MAAPKPSPPRPDRLPGLLALFATSALAVVGAVGWLGRTDSPWATAGAVALSLALAVLLIWRLAGGLGPAPRSGRTRVVAFIPPVAAVALLVPLGVVHATQPSTRPGSSPQGTVRGFLGAVVDTDGEQACGFLSASARLRLEAPARLGQTCESFFAGAAIRVGGAPLTSDGQLDRLHYAVTASGADREVVVSARGLHLAFHLRPATAVERHAFSPPATPWRIDSSVDGLG